MGNLPKPRFHAMKLLSKLGTQEIPIHATGDGAGSLVEAWASRDTDGRIAILLWNLTLDQTKAAGEPALTRRIALTLPDLDGTWILRQTPLNAGSGNIAATVNALGIRDWPRDNAQWAELAEAAKLHTTETTVSAHGSLSVELTLDMPSAVLVELSQDVDIAAG